MGFKSSVLRMRYSDWSNAFYGLVPVAAALAGLSWFTVMGLAVAWIALGIGSYLGHTRDSRLWWTVDVLTMYGAVMSIPIAVGAEALTPIMWLLYPTVLGLHWLLFKKRRMKLAVGVYGAAGLVSLLAVAGWIAFAPFVTFGLGLYYRLKLSSSNHDVEHGHWHTLSATAGTIAALVI